jgi:lipopolysaccharide export system protein LptA
MTPRTRPAQAASWALTLTVAAGLVLGTVHAHAERADRGKALTIDADRSGTVDLKNRVVTYLGNVVVTQGSMSIQAERVELREQADGRRLATAIGSASKPATFRQKREGVNELLEGTAQRIEYDDRSDIVRFVGTAAARRLRGTTVADEITGALITYDNLNEVFNVEGQAPNAASNSGGRTRAIFTPRGASAPATPAPAATPAAPAGPATTPTRP